MKVRNGGGKEIPHAQGKRNSSKMVGAAIGHQRADTLKPYSQKTSQSNHTRTTALSNSKSTNKTENELLTTGPFIFEYFFDCTRS